MYLIVTSMLSRFYDDWGSEYRLHTGVRGDDQTSTTTFTKVQQEADRWDPKGPITGGHSVSTYLHPHGPDTDFDLSFLWTVAHLRSRHGRDSIMISRCSQLRVDSGAGGPGGALGIVQLSNWGDNYILRDLLTVWALRNEVVIMAVYSLWTSYIDKGEKVWLKLLLTTDWSLCCVCFNSTTRSAEKKNVVGIMHYSKKKS